MTLAAPLLAAAGSSPRALWYLTRGAGAVTLLGLTGTLVLGITDTLRVRARSWPRFLLDALHRNLALVTLAVLAVHIATAVIDTFAPIRLIDVVVPFASAYRPLWVGLGALAFDLLIAVALTSAVRRRLGYTAWRAVHWAAYACWPLALVHGIGTGSDTRLTWMLALTAGCGVTVLIAATARLVAADAASRAGRLAVSGAVAASVAALVAWMAQGPLAPHWSRRAGTPVALLGAAVPARATVSARAARRRAPASAGATQLRASLAAPFSAQASGTIRRSVAGGAATIDMALALHGGAIGELRVRLSGRALPAGGVALTSGTVTLGPPGRTSQYAGPVATLTGGRLTARVTDRAGTAMDVRATLAIDATAGTVTGDVAATAAAQAAP